MQPTYPKLAFTYIALMALLALTAALSSAHLGPWTTAVALGIAGLKAILILLYFMHLRYSEPKVQVVALAAGFWIVILFSLTIIDYVSRGIVEIPGK